MVLSESHRGVMLLPYGYFEFPSYIVSQHRIESYMVCCCFVFLKTFLTHFLKDCHSLVAEPAKVSQISLIMQGGKNSAYS